MIKIVDMHGSSFGTTHFFQLQAEIGRLTEKRPLAVALLDVRFDPVRCCGNWLDSRDTILRLWRWRCFRFSKCSSGFLRDLCKTGFFCSRSQLSNSQLPGRASNFRRLYVGIIHQSPVPIQEDPHCAPVPHLCSPAQQPAFPFSP